MWSIRTPRQKHAGQKRYVYDRGHKRGFTALYTDTCAAQQMLCAESGKVCALERFVIRDIGRDEYIAEKTVMDAEYDRLLFAQAAVRSESGSLSLKKNTSYKARKLAGDALLSNALTRLVDLLIERVYVHPGDNIKICNR